MGGADGGCCTLKRGSGICILVLSIISLVGSIICAVIASATEMPLYAVFGWIHVLLLIFLISAGSAYVCCRACGSKVTGGLAVGYCVLAFVTFIVLATGPQSAMEHYCEGTVECASISDWGDHDRVRAQDVVLLAVLGARDGRPPPSRVDDGRAPPPSRVFVRLHVDIRLLPPRWQCCSRHNGPQVYVARVWNG